MAKQSTWINSIKQPQLDLKTHTVAQFTAEFFAYQFYTFKTHLSYSELLDGQCWNGFLALVADAGALLEDVAQIKRHQGRLIEEWYDILEKAAPAFHERLLAARGWPDLQDLAEAFGKIIDEHSEVVT